MRFKFLCFSIMLSTLVFTGCAGVDDAGMKAVYEDTGTAGKLSGVGIESQDIVNMTDKMVRKMLANPILAGKTPAPRVIVDAEYFRNEGSSRLNKNSITDRIRIGLNEAANGRMVFLGRHYSDMYEKERALKRKGAVDAGTVKTRKVTLGADYRLGGRITTLDTVHAKQGITSRYHQIIFEMVNLESGEIVWGGMYEFKKSGQQDIIYR